jgi:hypothetical protein
MPKPFRVSHGFNRVSEIKSSVDVPPRAAALVLPAGLIWILFEPLSSSKVCFLYFCSFLKFLIRIVGLRHHDDAVGVRSNLFRGSFTTLFHTKTQYLFSASLCAAGSAAISSVVAALLPHGSVDPPAFCRATPRCGGPVALEKVADEHGLAGWTPSGVQKQLRLRIFFGILSLGCKTVQNEQLRVSCATRRLPGI